MARETVNNAREVVSLYKKDKLNNDIIYEKTRKNNFVIVVTDENGYVLSAYDDMGEIDDKRINNIDNFGKILGNIHDAIDKSKNNEVYYRVEGERKRENIIFYGAFAQNDSTKESAYIFVISQLQPIDSVVAVLHKQFIFITAIALLMASVIAYVIARRFSKPVEKLTNTAKQIALGNYNVDFKTEEAFNEISDLSNALNYASKELNKSAEFRRELMANVSHDLRTPITMIKMYAEKIQDISGDNKEKREKDLQVIVDETDRLTLLVNDILELSKIENNKLDFEFKVFDISKTITKVLQRFSIMVAKGYTFALEAPECVYVLGDENRIEQVLYNLLSNAINYTGEDKKIKIIITKKFDCAKIEIIDSGEGISKDELSNVWDRYYRAKTHIRSQVGTGLGLSIVKTILIAHNADFGIESTIGVGSDFWFELKLPENTNNKTLRLADNNIAKDN